MPKVEASLFTFQETLCHKCNNERDENINKFLVTLRGKCNIINLHLPESTDEIERVVECGFLGEVFESKYSGVNEDPPGRDA